MNSSMRTAVVAIAVSMATSFPALAAPSSAGHPATSATLQDAGASGFASPSPAPPPGSELWVSRYDGPGNGNDCDDYCTVVASPDGSRVFVTGMSFGGGSGRDYLTVFYDPLTGAEQWVSRYNGPPNGSDIPAGLAVSPDGESLYVTGQSCVLVGCDDSSATPYEYDYVTLAYDTKTGAEVWTRAYDSPANGFDRATGVAVSPDGSRVFVTGETHTDFRSNTVSYDAATGAELWINQDTASVAFPDSVAVSPDGSSVLVTGTSWVGGQTGNYSMATVAYGAATGALIWSKLYDGGRGRDGGNSVVVSPDGGTVFVTGTSCAFPECGVIGTHDYATVAYDTSTGEQVWIARSRGPGSDWFGSSVAVSPDGLRVFVTGGHFLGDGLLAEYVTVALDAATGAEVWASAYSGPADRFDAATALAVSPDGSRVVVTGISGSGISYADPVADYATVAYDASTGAQMWVSRYHAIDHDRARSVAISPDGSSVFVTGMSWGPEGDYDLATIAYKA